MKEIEMDAFTRDYLLSMQDAAAYYALRARVDLANANASPSLYAQVDDRNAARRCQEKARECFQVIANVRGFFD